MGEPGDDSNLILVSYSTLEKASDNVLAAVNYIEEQLGQLDKYLAQLKARWTGDGSEAVTSKQDEWARAARNLNEVLAKIPPALNKARETYSQVEQQNTSVWA